SDEDAVRNAIRFIKEADADVVKLEGAGPSLSRVRAIVSAGIGVMGHVGLTPQSETILGGFKTQGRTASKARQLLADALALEAAGCFAIVLEAVPVPVAARITEALTVPTIGIGAGAACDGQVLVYHDLLGLTEGRAPRFVKRYANLADEIRGALKTYADEVRSGSASRRTAPARSASPRRRGRAVRAGSCRGCRASAARRVRACRPRSRGRSRRGRRRGMPRRLPALRRSRRRPGACWRRWSRG